MPGRIPRHNPNRYQPKLTVGVDYHGTLCRYTQGRHWEADRISPEGPTPGAIPWLLKVAERFIVAVTCARAADHPDLVPQLAQWLVKHGVPREWITFSEPSPNDRGPRIWVVRYKPRCWLYLDDRAYRFEGEFPDPETISDLRPWNR